MILDDGYMRKVLPFVKDEYFEGLYRKLYTTFKKYVEEYNRSPTKEAFILESNMTEQNFSVMQDAFDKLYKEEKVDTEWLVDQTEKWCQGRALEIAIVESVNVIEGKHDTLTKGALPDLLQKALGVAFDVNVGHDYIDNVEERWDFYDKKERDCPSILKCLTRSQRVVFQTRL